VPAWAVRACFEAYLLLYRSDSFASACRCTGSIELPLGNAREAVLDEALAVFERGEEIQHDVAQEQQVDDLRSLRLSCGQHSSMRRATRIMRHATRQAAWPMEHNTPNAQG
jgi:hypothetical protein